MVHQFILIYGPMFSGKSTELISRMRLYNFTGKKSVIIKYTRDARYADASKFTTHDDAHMSVASPILTTDKLMDIKCADYDVIGIEELQFFDDAYEFCCDMLKQKKILIATALNGTWKQEIFPNLLKILPLTFIVQKEGAVCSRCGKHGDNNDVVRADVSHKITKSSDLIEIGGADMYQALCLACHFADT